MKITGQDTLKTRSTLSVHGKDFSYFSIPAAEKSLGDVSRLPVSLKILLENVLRFEDGVSYTVTMRAPWRGGWRTGAAARKCHSSRRVY